MPMIQQFTSWFAKQKLSGKLAIGCAGLFMLCFVCSVPIAILSPSTPTTEIENTVVVEAVSTPTIEVVSSPIATETAIPTDAPQVAPTETPLPPTPFPTANLEIIVETAKIIDAPVQQVEAMLGKPIETLSLGIGEVEEVPDGGESRTYRVGKYTIWVNYDKNGIAKGLQIVDGLLDDGYSLDQWGVILARIGVDFVGLPDIEAPAARRWTNAHGYAIMIAANKVGGKVWTVRIYKIP
ncbi:MAG TPA: hypothetical protein VNK89_09350 [Thermoflexus sp.]|nr:hypothetical protein [Thermoflexus sp.]